MANLEKWQMGDPERVAMIREAKRMNQDAVCGECAHRCVKTNNDLYCELINRRYGEFKCGDFKTTHTIRLEDLFK